MARTVWTWKASKGRRRGKPDWGGMGGKKKHFACGSLDQVQINCHKKVMDVKARSGANASSEEDAIFIGAVKNTFG